MNRRFRKRRFRRLGLFVVLATMAVVSLSHQSARDHNARWLPAGDYSVQAIRHGYLLQLADTSNASITAQVQLLGIKPPRDLSTAQEREGMSLLKKLVAGRIVTLRLDRRRIDTDGTLLGYVFADDVFVNARLVQTGLAVADTRSEDCPSLVRQIRRAQDEARTSGRGVWQLRNKGRRTRLAS